MNVAVALLVGAAVVPFVAIDVHRKFRKWQRAQEPFRGTRLHDGVPPFDIELRPLAVRTPPDSDASWVNDAMRRLAERPLGIPTNDAVWIGLDLAAGDDLCSEHGTASYAADDQSSFGTIDGVSE